VFQYGAPGWVPVTGSWNGGRAGVGAFDPSTATWYLRNEAGAGPPDAGVFGYGLPGWVPVAGDWSGSGRAGVGAFDPSTATWYIRNEASAGSSDAGAYGYGLPGWVPVVGDWDGNGKVTPGVYDAGSGAGYPRSSDGAGAPGVPAFSYAVPGGKPVPGSSMGGGFGTAPDTGGLVADPLPPGPLEGVPTYTLAGLARVCLFSNDLTLDPGAAALGWSPAARSRQDGAAGAATDVQLMSS
jgi:hypothetical protein